MSRLVSVALTISSGALYGLSYPTARLQLLAWVALVPFFLALRGARLGWSLVLGWLWTTSAAWAVGDWFATAVARYYQQPLVVGLGFFVGVSGLMAAPFYMTFAAAYRTLVRRSAPTTPLVVAAAWVAAELARTRLAGNPWALFGYSQMGIDTLVQVADLAGVYGVTFVLVAVNAALAQLLVASGGERRAAVLSGMLTIGVAGGVLAYGSWRLAAAEDSGRPAEMVRVGMVQANLEIGALWNADDYGRNLDVYLQLTKDLLRTNPPPIVFWPESALTFFLEDEPLYRAAIASVLAPHGAELVAGGPRADGAESHTYYNSAFHISPTGRILGVYDKQRLVPFAEYFPWRSLELLRRRFARVREFTAGASQPPFRTTAGPAGVTICNEAMFPEIASERVREGARFLVDPAHDTWLTPRFSAQQFDIVRLRAVEQRRWLVRASTSGPSAVVDPWGRVIVSTAFETRTAVTGRIIPRDDVTPYHRVGDAFAAGCTLVAIAAWLRGRRRSGAGSARQRMPYF